jgi:hypothetical protein
MTIHKYFTRAELTVLDSYAKGVKVSEIALQLGRSESGVWRSLRLLGIKNYARQRLPDDSPLRCTTCGILKTEAEYMDGPGDGRDCRYCACLKQGINLYEPLPLPGGDAPELKVFEAYGMAAGRDDR